MKMLKEKDRLTSAEKKKIAIMIFLFCLLVLDIIYVAFWRDDIYNTIRNQFQKTDKVEKEYVTETEQTEIKDESTQDTQEQHTSGDTSQTIVTNLDVYVTPLLEENSFLVDKALIDYCKRTNQEIKEATVFHVMIPEEAEDKLYFFCKFTETNEIVQLIYERETKSVEVALCEYTEQEIVDEVWEGVEPAIRDIQ